MKRYKGQKVTAALLALLLAASLAGCGETASETAAQTENAAPETREAAESAAGTETAAAESAVETAAAEVSESAGETQAEKAEIRADHTIVLNSAENSDGTWTHTAVLDGTEVKEYDYTWNCDISEDHDEVKNCPAEFYTGEEPGEDAGAVYIAHDLYYYPEIPEESFQLVSYDGEQEWAVYYPETSEYSDYIFATLPSGKTMGSGGQASVPTQMMHSAEEAAENAKLHITQPGSYSVEGTWHGQIWIDLGDQDETFADENAKVTLYLNGVDVTCTVAPALVFWSVYECDNTWEARETWSQTVDTSDAGAVVILADGTENNFSGVNVYRMLKTKLKDEEDTSEVPVQKKARKTDAAFYSCRTMNVEGGTEGTGVLNVTSGFEGLDTELHLTVNGGNINIFSQDDGINCNEDGVSVVTVNGGNVHILAGLGTEGDGVDSNGFLTINGGTVVSMANPASDSGLDSDCGSFINGGTVLALGSTMDWAEADDSADPKSVTMNLRFTGQQSADEAVIVTDTNGTVVFAYDPDQDEIASGNARTYQGAIISCESFEVGKAYYVYVGGDVTGEETAGIYDVSTVTGFTEDAVQQGYSGQDGFGFGGMGGPGGERPSMQDGETPPELPSGEMPSMGEGETPPAKPEGGQQPEAGKQPEGGQQPEGGKQPESGQQPEGGKQPEGGQQPEGGMTPPEKPDGEMPSFAEGEQPSMPEGMTPPEGFDPGQGVFGEGETVSASELTTEFLLEDSVSSFSGVQDYQP